MQEFIMKVLGVLGILRNYQIALWRKVTSQWAFCKGHVKKKGTEGKKTCWSLVKVPIVIEDTHS